MNKYLLATTAAAMALLLLAPALMAQTTLTGVSDVTDKLDDIEEDVAEDFKRSDDASRFGNPEFRPGLSGSASLSFVGKTGEIDSSEISLGTRLRYAQGKFVQNLGIVIEFDEADGVKSKEDVFGVYDANYYFAGDFYGFVLGRVKTDGLAETVDDVQTDAFIGFGPGYRVVNTSDLAWRVQAGPGVSYIKDGAGEETSEIGYIASSRLYWKLTDNLFVTNDTDVLTSDAATRVNNDLGFNVKVSDAFSTRISYLTDYNDSRAFKTENKLGVALVYGF